MKIHILTLAIAAAVAAEAATPNIVFIYADDIGYGDFSSYGATKISTPNVDKVAAGGVRHTNGHSTAATCTPSRYALLTGRYAWRQKGTQILPGDANLIIPTDQITLPSLLKKAGYVTSLVGKWHLGLGSSEIDWNQDVKPGPLEIGFDEALFIPATGDRTPTVLMENRRVRGLDAADPLRVSYKENFHGEPTGILNPELLKMVHSHGHNMSVHNGIGRIGFQTGGVSARWTDEDIAGELAARAVKFIEEDHVKPFFLYLSTHDIHVPRAPHQRFVGKSGMGPRGDALLEFDWTVGEITAALDRKGLTKDTVLIISSDNGPVLDDGYQDQAVTLVGEHKPAGPWRGGKGSAFEAGTRVPFIVRWPDRVKPSVSSALVSQIDLLASFATLTEQKLEGEQAPDSTDQLAALLGESEKGRDSFVREGAAFSITRGDWKYIEPTKAPNPVKVTPQTGTETGRDNVPQLYNLKDDPGETNNLAESNPMKLAELVALLKQVRTTPSSRSIQASAP